MTVGAGEFLGVIGHTGSGKSTLIQHLNGLLQPTSGRILLEGKDIWADPKKIRDVRFKVGLISKTTDDGETWTSILYPGLGSGGLLFSRIKILDDSLIVVSGKCANECDKWPIMTSKDGGVTWTENQIHPDNYGYSPEVMALAVVSNSRIVGYDRTMNLPINTNDFENWYYNQGSFGG
jgi:ABC-type dipeptide/oligopeptide/nickel transport system ATPase component